MTGMGHIAAGRRTAHLTLRDHCTITRPTAGEWTPDDGLPATEEPVWTGPCSLSASPGTRGVRTDYASDDRAILVQILRVPHDTDCPAGPTGVQGGDLVTVASQPGLTFTVLDEQTRTNRVLQRLRIVNVNDTDGVPR